MRSLPLLVCLGFVFSGFACNTAPSQQTSQAQQDSIYQYRPASRDGIGKVYLGREIAQVMGHLGAGWLERPQREQEERTDRLLDVLDLRPTDVVADIGAGTGYFSFRLARLVPQGKVLAVDIQQEMIDYLEANKRRNKAPNVQAILGTISDPKLPANSVDLALMVDAYHEFSHPREMMEQIRKALRPGGRVVLVEYRADDPQVMIKELHKMSVAQASREMKAVGLRLEKTLTVLPQQHILVFRK